MKKIGFFRKMKYYIALMLFFTIIINTNAQNIKCVGPWGGAGGIGDPAWWTHIQQPNNANDPATGRGKVTYVYSYLDRFVRINEWVQFMNAVDPSGSGSYAGELVNFGMVSHSGGTWHTIAWTGCSASSGQSISATTVGKLAVSYISFNLAARFCNWMNTGSVNSGPYTFASSSPNANVTSVNLNYAGVRLPTENEFYKAAFYNPSTSSYNNYGTIFLDGANEPIRSTISSNGVFNTSNGHAYELPMHLWSHDPSGLHCLWQIQAGQGGYSAYGLYNMVGGFHHYLTDGSNPTMIFRPDNQLSGPSGQDKYWRADSFSPSEFYASPSFHLVIVGEACGGGCSLSSAGKTNESCNNNSTASDPSDDYISFRLNPTGSGLGSGYSVSVNNGGTITPSSGTYGVNTTFRLQNGSANNTTFTITITDNATSGCTITTTVKQASCSNACLLTGAGKTNEACNNNGTGSNPVDDYITFSLNPTGSNLGTTYTVTANNGGTVTPASGSYGSATNFRLQNGSASSTTFTITITDANSGTCSITTTVMQNSCSADCNIAESGICNINCSNTGADNTNSNDYIIFDLNPTGLNLGATYNVTVSTGTVTLANGNPATGVAYGSSKSFRLQNGSAGAGNVTITITDVSHPGCTMSFTLTDPGSCSTTCPPAYMLGTGESYTFTTQSSNIDVNTIQWYKSTDGGLTFSPIAAPQGTSQTITINAVGQYYYTANGLDGCKDSSCCHIILIPANCSDCQLLTSGISNQQCNNNGTQFNASDDYITFSLNPQGSLTGTTYNVSVNNGGTITPTSGTYGSTTNFRLQNGSANNTLYTITITDISDPACTITTTVQMGPCAAACSITDIGKTNQDCNDNNTKGITTDDYITFSLNPTGSNLAASGYTVTVSGGGTVIPTTGTYGAPTNFQLQNGSANGTTYTITVTDNVNATCTATTTVNEAACSVCGIAATTAPDCNNNNTMAIKTDDYFTVIVNGTTTTPGTSNKYIIVYNGTTLNPGGTTYGTQFTIGTNKIFSANGASTYILLIKDFDDPTCYVSKTVGPVANCSECPVPDCLNVQMKKN